MLSRPAFSLLMSAFAGAWIVPLLCPAGPLLGQETPERDFRRAEDDGSQPRDDAARPRDERRGSRPMRQERDFNDSEPEAGEQRIRRETTVRRDIDGREIDLREEEDAPGVTRSAGRCSSF